MSTQALEHAVYDLGTNRERRALFRDDRATFLHNYALTADEAEMLERFDVRAMQAAGVNAMACMGFWMTMAPDKRLPAYVTALNEERDPNG